MSKTIRLIIPQWKGGMRSYYEMGAEILAAIAPSQDNQKTIEITINPDKVIKEINGIYNSESQLQELKKIVKICEEEAPDKIIVFGGDCSVSQGPFDYLSQKYGANLGVIWLDAHPDISNLEISGCNHELVLANIMGFGDNVFSKQLKNPISPLNVLYGGLVEDPSEKLKAIDKRLRIPIIDPDLIFDFETLKNWIDSNHIKKLCVHFDLDVLSPEYFRSLTSSNPYENPKDYGAAIGELEFKEVVKSLNKANEFAEIVGLSITELVPWDLINLRKAMSELPIFE